MKFDWESSVTVENTIFCTILTQGVLTQGLGRRHIIHCYVTGAGYRTIYVDYLAVARAQMAGADAAKEDFEKAFS